MRAAGLWLALLGLHGGSAGAQQPKVEKQGEAAWVEPAPGELLARIGVITPSLSFSVEPIARLNQPTIEYQPSAKSRTAVGVSYGPVGLSLGLNNPIPEDDRARNGESRVTDWQFRFYGKHATWDIVYQDYEGYYIDNTEQFDPSRDENSPRLQRSDIRNVHYGVQLTYVTRPEEYNIGSAFDLGARQLRSGGSFFWTGAIDHNRMTAGASIVPEGFRSSYGALGTLTSGTFSTFSVGAGYGKTWVGRNGFFLGGLFGMSVGAQQQTSDSVPAPSFPWTITAGTKVKFGTGINGERMFGGFFMHFDQNRMGVMDGVLTFSAAEGGLFWGMRFDTKPRAESQP